MSKELIFNWERGFECWTLDIPPIGERLRIEFAVDRWYVDAETWNSREHMSVTKGFHTAQACAVYVEKRLRRLLDDIRSLFLHQMAPKLLKAMEAPVQHKAKGSNKPAPESIVERTSESQQALETTCKKQRRRRQTRKKRKRLHQH